MQLSRRQALSSLGSLLSLPAFARLAPGIPPLQAGEGSAEILEAVRKGELERVRRLLAGDAGLARARDESGRSAYVLAHVHGHVAVAELLVAELLRGAGLKLDIVEAVLAEDWKRLEDLARTEPDLLHRAHPIGGTPLYAAALVGSDDAYRLRSLGCSPDTAPPGGSGFTATRGALESPHPGWALRGLADLCGNGADVNARQRGGSSVLHAAVGRRDRALVRLAIRKGADAAAVDEAGRTARALALQLGWGEGAELLAEPHRLPRDNRTSRFALDANREPVRRPDLADVPQSLQNQATGASHFQLEKLRELVAADKRLIFSISTDDELAIEACAHVQNTEILRYHLDHGAPLSLPTAVALRDVKSARAWLEHDPTLVHERGAHDFPVLWFAVGGGALEIAELLLRHAIPIDQESRGTTTLHRCASADDVELAHWLLEHGADPEAVGYFGDREGQTPLQVATAGGHTRVAALLKGAGARR
jgi:ankyrin repeat protein